ncbi:MAG TPA: VTT domain-containing protein [Chitinophagaceae bacterium]|nr:VTT domain-containing protein [Chitinophagaceae bacterium]
MPKLPLVISLSLLFLLVVLYFVLPSFQNFIKEAFDVLTSNNEERITQWVAKFKLAGPVMLILIMVVQMFFFVVPNIFVMIVAIISYGPFWGSVISFVGVFASSSTGYMIGKFLGPVTIHKLMSEKTLQKASLFIKRYGVTAIAITRISSFSNDSLSIVAGLLKMNYRKYILATLAGITPLIVLLAIYGKNGKILRSLIWIAVISLVILIVYILLEERRKKKSALRKMK